ncbi:Ldh family oxidoreductase [Pseudomonas oryzihabitans]|uniref:Ldh family oxidoreductase n=1 Tax=Pseudomonas oryzihabitans TaxID=47885 RepID=UPI002895AF0A|nr:Ldh family oxidoreductase [Pseudomonas oryzihabitans]MDT3718164.1 Ldh family oxidoreductase [Pseudomonas oryzihabitans]
MSPSRHHSLTKLEAETLVRACCLRQGASQAVADALTAATLAAERHGRPTLGFAHLLDYLDGFRQGRIDPSAEPVLTRPAPALIQSDARRGIAQLGFDRAFADLQATASSFGLALFAQREAFTCGELGYYTRRLAERDLVALAFTNGSPLLAPQGSRRALYSTNPLAFAALADDGRLLAIDQACSATAFVNLLRAARADEPIPEGWALDESGQPTRNARAAVRGTLLAFGGARGANIALMVEVLAAGLTGANWSLDAGDFRQGSCSPGAGLLVVAIAPRLLDDRFPQRLGAQLTRLADQGVHLPGITRGRDRAAEVAIRLPADLHSQLSALA